MTAHLAQDSFNLNSKQSNRTSPILLALVAGLIGAVLAACSLAHNIEGVLPRISAPIGTFHYYLQWLLQT